LKSLSVCPKSQLGTGTASDKIVGGLVKLLFRLLFEIVQICEFGPGSALYLAQ
jgi:hypothetical protein